MNLSHGFTLQQVKKLVFLRITEPRCTGKRTVDTHMSQIDMKLRQTSQDQGFEQQGHHFNVRRNSRFTIELHAGLSRRSGGQRVLGLGVDHMTGITETVGGGGAEAVRLHSCCLRGEVSANHQGSSSQLIRYLECQQVYIAPEADKQGI